MKPIFKFNGVEITPEAATLLTARYRDEKTGKPWDDIDDVATFNLNAERPRPKYSCLVETCASKKHAKFFATDNRGKHGHVCEDCYMAMPRDERKLYR